MFRTKVMGKTNQLLLNLPNGTFPLSLSVEALINFVLCGAAQKKLLGDKMCVFHYPSLTSVTVVLLGILTAAGHTFTFHNNAASRDSRM